MLQTAVLPTAPAGDSELASEQKPACQYYAVPTSGKGPPRSEQGTIHRSSD